MTARHATRRPLRLTRRGERLAVLVMLLGIFTAPGLAELAAPSTTPATTTTGVQR